ncbi:MAG: hypothetical protein HWQ35_09485 [Nostoc sp. NMS1]|nr:hypothetical protein [Nostoc sp. NMS1]MBN3989372.1 hypothetical protein [Nostoc sp. NMS2]
MKAVCWNGGDDVEVET